MSAFDTNISRRGALRAALLALMAGASLPLGGCGGGTTGAASDAGDNGSAGTGATDAGPDFRNTDLGCGWEPTGSLELAYAKQVTVDYFDGGFSLICVTNGERYLTVPEGAAAPEGLAEDIACVTVPASNVYLVSTGLICVLDELGQLGSVGVSSVTPETSPNENFSQLIEAGDVVFGGRYREPDFEIIAQAGCPLAIENTQINRYPEIKQKLQDLGCVVFTEYSSTEDDVLGRLEWIKVVGTLFGCEDEAAALFDQICARVEAVAGEDPTGKSVVFFYIDEDGSAVVRRAGDYFAQMIQIAGGEPVSFDAKDEDGATATYITVEMEEFFATAKDADVIIYNSTVDEGTTTIDALVARNELLGQFAAVGTGEVYTCNANLYQQMTSTDTIIEDLRALLTGAADSGDFFWKMD